MHRKEDIMFWKINKQKQVELQEKRNNAVNKIREILKKSWEDKDRGRINKQDILPLSEEIVKVIL